MRVLGRTVIFCLIAIMSGRALADPAPATRIADGIKAVLMLENAKTDGILTVSDNNLFVQCLGSHFLPAWRCEAAGFEGQPWLHHVLTLERQTKLAALGFKPDAEFGNFLALIPKTTAPDALADLIFRVLTEAYAVQSDDIEVKAERLPSRHCHRRIKAGHDRGGALLTPTLGFKQDAENGCRMKTNAEENYDDPTAIMPATQGIDVDARYILAMTTELQRVEGAGEHVYVIFEAGPAYVQCMHYAEGKRMYCEAVSEDAVGKPIKRILTPERKAKLLQAGFAPPGKVMNYSRFYPADQYDMPALAKVLLGILKDVYGYQGAPPMNVQTENGPKRPLAL